MNIQSKTHRMTGDKGNFSVWPLAKRQLTITTIGDDGSIVTSTLTNPTPSQQMLIDGMNSYPLFSARWDAKGKSFDVDLDCGARRWNGPKSKVQVGAALRKCGFSSDQIKIIL